MRKKYEKHGLRNTKLYSVWDAMRRRCYSKNSQEYERYGSRGISVCSEWMDSFLSFYEWANNNGYAEGLYLDRKSNDLGYSPENCRFITPLESTLNVRKLFKNNTSGYKGVSWDKSKKKWMSHITVGGNFIFLGYFNLPELAYKQRVDYVELHNLKHNQ